ncbi:MAG: nitroreductase/quinone reductase family protein [Gammaproteobacteria bacterium]|nr:nitroreductase/quinone reductase family protein [Gammaproteobacteria bacterium]
MVSAPMRDRFVKATLRVFADLHKRFFRFTGGRFAAGIGPVVFLLLVTRGHKTGLERVTPLLHTTLDGAYIVAASYAGTENHPAWYWNLRGQPEAVVEIKGAKQRVQVLELEGERREQAWAALVSAWPFFVGYQKRTTRQIPVFELRPIDLTTRQAPARTPSAPAQ